MTIRWLAEARPPHTARIGTTNDAWVAEWPDLGSLHVAHETGESRFEAKPGACPSQVCKLLEGTARLLVRHAQGHVGLHASAVTFGDAAVGFLGDSGQGKSTLAAFACLHHDAALVCDDALALERRDAWCVVPTERTHWIDQDLRDPSAQAGGEKAPCMPRAFREQSARLSLLVLLSYEASSGPRLVPLSPIDAMAALVPSVVRLVIDDPRAQRSEFDALSDLVNTVPVVRLDRPRGVRYLSDTVSLIRRHLR